MEKRNLYIVVTIVLIVGLALSFYNFTGQSTLGTDKGKCIDSDNGNNKFTRGTASYENRIQKYTDYCYSDSGYGDDTLLKEYFCVSDIGEIDAVEHRCENGCLNGACVR